jgi:hypothetical protein
VSNSNQNTKYTINDVHIIQWHNVTFMENCGYPDYARNDEKNPSTLANAGRPR